jgi:hypothetical protein
MNQDKLAQQPRSYIAFSGGVDSTALALLMPDAILVFTDTCWEFPETYAHIDKFEAVTGREVIRVKQHQYPGGIPQYIRERKFMPSHGARYCTRLFKIESFNTFLANYPGTLNIALRADEEQRTGNLTKGIVIKYPLRERNLNRLDCLTICIDHDLLPRAPIYMARGGCKGCFYKRKSEIRAMCALVPNIMDELQALEEDVQDARQNFFTMFPNTGMSIAQLRSQPALFTSEEVYGDAANRKQYGATCGLFCNR